jgi:glucose/arabinose dehydrogenase
MNNKILIGTIVSLTFLFGVFVYSQYEQAPAENRNNQPAQTDEKQDKNTNTSSVATPKNWQNFSTTSFSFSHPSKVQVDTERGDVRLRLIGPDSQMGSEITDGFTFYVDIESMSGLSLESFAQKKLDTEKSQRELVEPMGKINLNNRTAYKFVIRTNLGVESTKIIMESGNENKAFTISYVVQDPADRDYKNMVDKMIQTLQIKPESETSATTQKDKTTINRPDVEVVAKNLEIPWDLVFLPDGDMLVTERPGRLLRIDENGSKTPITLADSTENIPGTKHVGEGGLLGVALHPDFAENNIIYLYQTSESESGDGLINRVEQYKLVDNQLKQDSDTKTIIDNIPGAVYHDGGRIAFGPDEKLYITAGDATNEDWAQIYQQGTKKDLAGSILRLNPDGSIPEDNPFGSPVWSYGHRNPQGLTWDNQGQLWSTEHGRSGLLSGLDEINLIEPGNNYGWPDSEGDTVEEGTVSPIEHSGADTTWAPASALYWDGSIFFGGLRGEALYEAVLENGEVVEVKSHLKNKYGRIRTVVEGPDGMFYLTTSNRDGRGSPVAADDRIIRVNPEIFR